MALTTRLDLMLSMVETATSDFGAPTSRVNYAKTLSLATGVANGQADMRWSDQIVIGSAATHTLDLAAVLVGAFGNTLTFVKLKCLIVHNLTGTVTVTRPTANGVPWINTANVGIVLPTNGTLVFWNQSLSAVAVTAGTGDLIDLVAGAAGATCDVHLVGTSA